MVPFIRLLLLFLLSVSLYAGTPTSYLLSSTSSTLTTGDSVIVTISSVTFSGDSTGIMVEVNQDSVSGNIRYKYVSPNGYSDTTQFNYLPVLYTFVNNEKGIFTSVIPRIAGANSVMIYVVFKNNKSTTLTFSKLIYSITWRN